MTISTNCISILRKHVNNNVPGFDDPEVGQNGWVKLYDFCCIDWAYGNTVQNYDLEHDPNYNNNGNKQGANFYVSSPSQSIKPPYNIHTGDFIAYRQGTTLFLWRIVKINQAQIFKDCEDYELICDMFQPKEADVNLEAGVLRPVVINDQGDIIDGEGYPSSKEKVTDYLYEMKYDFIDYDYAYDYFRVNGDFNPSACSAVRNGVEFGRNLDWYYSNDAEFIVHTPHSDTRKAVVGTCGGVSVLSNTFVESNLSSEKYKILPFQMQDGVNEDGLTACYNVVPTDYGKKVTEPTEKQEVEISVIMLVRFILDKFSTAEEAANYVQKHCRVYTPKALHNSDYDLHIMIADANQTLVLEFVDGNTEIINVDAAPYMTNFLLYDVTPNDDGKVYTPATQDDEHDATITNGITAHGAGLERYNLIVDGYDNKTVREIMTDLTYTRMYIGAPNHQDWYTEYVGGMLTVADYPEAFEHIEQVAGQWYADRNRNNPVTWQTMHSVVYDMVQKKMEIQVQELPETYTFYLGGVNE